MYDTDFCADISEGKVVLAKVKKYYFYKVQIIYSKNSVYFIYYYNYQLLVSNVLLKAQVN